jgi:hypothetical protein
VVAGNGCRLQSVNLKLGNRCRNKAEVKEETVVVSVHTNVTA